jgi:hypothetical protein
MVPVDLGLKVVLQLLLNFNFLLSLIHLNSPFLDVADVMLFLPQQPDLILSHLSLVPLFLYFHEL